MATTKRKTCEKCGRAVDALPRERRCKAVVNVWGGTSRYCWGKLTAVKRKRVRPTLETELAQAHAQLANAITRVKRAVTSVDHWQRRIKAIGKRIDERDHPQPKKPRPARKRTRIITLPPDELEIAAQ